MKIAVYCGSSSGKDTSFSEKTKILGEYLASAGIDIVYGGGKVGLMGCIADAVLDKGGKVFGVIPKALSDREIAHPNLTELTIVTDMHKRKARMAEMSDAFVALPGGAGTLEEIFEAWTWGQLGYHSKPVAFYNISGYFNGLLAMLEEMGKGGFIKQQYLDSLIIADNPKELKTSILSFKAPEKKWT